MKDIDLAIVPVPTCKLYAHNYIPKILGGGGSFWSTCLLRLFSFCTIDALLSIGEYDSIRVTSSLGPIQEHIDPCGSFCVFEILAISNLYLYSIRTNKSIRTSNIVYISLTLQVQIK